MAYSMRFLLQDINISLAKIPIGIFLVLDRTSLGVMSSSKKENSVF